MDSVEAAGMSYVDVAKDVKDSYYGKKSPTKVLMVKKFNKVSESDTISMIYNPTWRWSEENRECINKGLVMGTILGRKLESVERVEIPNGLVKIMVELIRD